MSHNTLSLLAAALVLGLAASAPADTVRLANGGTVEGKATRAGDKVIVDTRFGEVTFDADEVLSITKGKTRFERYLEKRKASDLDDAKEQIALGDWCRELELKTEARRHWKRALELDPRNETAGKRLGLIRYKDKWLTQDQYRKERGFVKVDGEWLTREQARERDAEERRAKEFATHKKKIDSCVKLMSSMKRKTRLKGKVELQKYAESREDLKLAAFASDVADYYNAAWGRVRRSLVLLEVRATHTQLKRPIPVFTTTLGTGPPVRIQTPELAVVQVKTTVLTPADIELDEDP